MVEGQMWSTVLLLGTKALAAQGAEAAQAPFFLTNIGPAVQAAMAGLVLVEFAIPMAW